jgi:carbamate kinase
LLKRGELVDVETQRSNLARAVESLAALAREHELVVTHGNGPQVGLLALQAEAYHGVRPYPLDVLGAETEGMVGYMIEQGLRAQLPERETATLLTQVIVDPDDPAFGSPTKPIGPIYEESEARVLAQGRGWTIAREGRSWRRVVASPEPRSIVELSAIRLLVEAGVLVVCVGGGGVPVIHDESGALRGVEAVIDKDLAAALLARDLDADALLLLTDVDAIELDYGTPRARPLKSTTPADLRALDLPDGSMGPKAEAAARFVEPGPRLAAICSVDAAAEALAGRAGTLVREVAHV